MIERTSLEALPPFKGYPEAELDVLLGVAEERCFAAGAFLCEEGAPASSCFIVLAGKVDVYKTTSNEGSRVATLGPGALLGQVALVDRGPRSASARAASLTTTLELSREVFERLLATHSPFALRFQEQVAVVAIRQLRASTERLAAARARAASEPGSSAPVPSELRYIQSMLTEWGLDAAELDNVTVVSSEPRMKSLIPPRIAPKRGA